MASYLYQEIVGGAVFLLGLWLVWRGGELSGPGCGRRRVLWLLGGLAFLAFLQGAILWLAGR